MVEAASVGEYLGVVVDGSNCGVYLVIRGDRITCFVFRFGIDNHELNQTISGI